VTTKVLLFLRRKLVFGVARLVVGPLVDVANTALFCLLGSRIFFVLDLRNSHKEKRRKIEETNQFGL
jgi:hypothetical protein